MNRIEYIRYSHRRANSRVRAWIGSVRMRLVRRSRLSFGQRAVSCGADRGSGHRQPEEVPSSGREKESVGFAKGGWQIHPDYPPLSGQHAGQAKNSD